MKQLRCKSLVRSARFTVSESWTMLHAPRLVPRASAQQCVAGRNLVSAIHNSVIYQYLNPMCSRCRLTVKR
jgi:hypothetical protein